MFIGGIIIDYVIENENLVRSIVNKYNGYYDSDDLYQVGMIGLMKAFDKFDSSKGFKFSTYAYNYVLGEVTKYMRENRNIKLSRDIIKLKQSITKVKERLSQKLCREPSNLEIALVLEVDEEKISEIEMVTADIQSLDYNYGEDDMNLYQAIKVEDQEMDSGILDLRDSINELPLEEQQLIYSRYYMGLTQKETSEELGISQVQVSRKEAKILQKLRGELKTSN